MPHAFVLDANQKVVYSGHPMEPACASKLQEAVAAAQQQVGGEGRGGGGAGAAKRAVPPVTQSYEELMRLGVKALKALLDERGVGHADCLEKGDLAKRVVERCSKVTHYV